MPHLEILLWYDNHPIVIYFWWRIRIHLTQCQLLLIINLRFHQLTLVSHHIYLLLLLVSLFYKLLKLVLLGVAGGGAEFTCVLLLLGFGGGCWLFGLFGVLLD